MKRKLISFDAFRKIEESSFTNAENELIQAEEVLAKTLGVEQLNLHSFGESDVTYQTNDGNFVHAVYTIDKDKVILENIQMLVIDEQTEKKAARKVISDMLDSILENKDKKANELFESYMNMPSIKREINEAVSIGGFKLTVSKPKGLRKPSKLKGRHQNPADVKRRIESRMKTLRGLSTAKKQTVREKARKIAGAGQKRVYARKIKPSAMKEWLNMCENVIGYLDFKATGSLLRESTMKTDSQGNVVAVAIPTIQKRNEGKVLDMGLQTIDSTSKVLRGKMKKIHEDQNFVKAMADLKRYNNISDSSALEETLEAIISRWPDVLYVTESELAEQIAVALETAGVKNYDDATCAFMAEAILRSAHNAYTERVRKIATLAGAKNDVTSECESCSDAYKDFAEVADLAFAQIDESTENEFRIFSDLYNALLEVHRVAAEIGDEATRIDAADFMQECSAILNNRADVDLSLAEAIADYLADLLEAAGEGDAGIDAKPEISVGGDHSMTKYNAKQAAVSSNNTGSWKDAAPVSDGKDYDKGLADEMGNDGFSNIASGDTWPDMKNPYVPKSMMYKMKEKSVFDDSEDLGTMSSGDTWPNLKNPMAPKPVMPKPVV